MERLNPAPATAVKPRLRERFAGGTANATFTLQDQILAADTTGGSITHTLPAASSVPAGTEFCSIWLKPGTNDLVIAPNGTDFLDGVNATFSCTTKATQAVRLVSNGVNGWIVVSSAAGLSAAQALVNCPRVIVAGGLSAAAEAGNAIVVTLTTASLGGAPQAIEQPYAVELVDADGDRVLTADWTITVPVGLTMITTNTRARINFVTDVTGQTTLTVTDVSGVFVGTVVLKVTPMYNPLAPISTPGIPTYLALTFA